MAGRWYRHYVVPLWVPFAGGHRFAVNWKIVLIMLFVMVLMVVAGNWYAGVA